MIGLDTNVLAHCLPRHVHVVRALCAFRVGSADVADCLIERMAAYAGCTETMTFDSAAAKSAGMTLIR